MIHRSENFSGRQRDDRNHIQKIICNGFCTDIAANSIPAQVFATKDTKYSLVKDSLVNTGKDTGYAETNAIDKNDPHWNWTLGEF